MPRSKAFLKETGQYSPCGLTKVVWPLTISLFWTLVKQLTISLAFPPNVTETHVLVILIFLFHLGMPYSTISLVVFRRDSTLLCAWVPLVMPSDHAAVCFHPSLTAVPSTGSLNGRGAWAYQVFIHVHLHVWMKLRPCTSTTLYLLWFSNRQALLSVAETFFENVDLGDDEIKVHVYNCW